jgi:hypothetical protein
MSASSQTAQEHGNFRVRSGRNRGGRRQGRRRGWDRLVKVLAGAPVRFNGKLSFLVLFVNIEVLLFGQLLLVILDLLSSHTYTRHPSIEKIMQVEGLHCSIEKQ